MAIGIGIDFGTTNSSAAVCDESGVRQVALEEGSAILPSATYLDRKFQVLTGQGAILTYVADNTGRTVELIPEVIGEESEWHSPVLPGSTTPLATRSRPIYGLPLEDSGLKGRLFMGVKRLLGSEKTPRLAVFERQFRLAALITPILKAIRESVEREAEISLAVCVGRPVNYEGRDRYKNQTALQRMADALKSAGLGKHEFIEEPVAAATSFLRGSDSTGLKHVLTVDFGGGTLDLCVMKIGAGGKFEVVATHGLALGGVHIDQRILRKLVFPLLGEGGHWLRRTDQGESQVRFPFGDFEPLLLNWAVSHQLNQNRFTSVIQQAIEGGGADLPAFQRLMDYVRQNLGFVVFDAISQCKIALSEGQRALLDIPELDIAAEVTRSEFEWLVDDLLEQFSEAVQHTLKLAGLEHAAIDLVLRTGGSSEIPAVIDILDCFFPGRVVRHDTFGSVSKGLAVMSYERHQRLRVARGVCAAENFVGPA